MESRSLLVSDVDNTVLDNRRLGDDAATRAFAAWIEGNRHRLRLAYNSGRFPASVAQSVAETDLPTPDAIIGGVGTQIYFPDSDSHLPDWPTIRNGDWDSVAVRAALDEFEELEIQPEELLSAHKVSYYGYDLPAVFLTDLGAHLTQRGLNAKIIYSSARDLDILPACSGKGLATQRLAEHWQLASDDVIVSGDSGNDLAMFEHGFRGIVVGNAHAELKALRGEYIYHARGEFANGVIEGLEHWLNAS